MQFAQSAGMRKVWSSHVLNVDVTASMGFRSKTRNCRFRGLCSSSTSILESSSSCSRLWSKRSLKRRKRALHPDLLQKSGRPRGSLPGLKRPFLSHEALRWLGPRLPENCDGDLSALLVLDINEPEEDGLSSSASLLSEWTLPSDRSLDPGRLVPLPELRSALCLIT